MESKFLIISPQAGFGNRLRALCSCILIAKETNRKPYHVWTPVDCNQLTESTCATMMQPYMRMQLRGWDSYFIQNDDFPLATSDLFPTIDKIISEWGPNDYWYSIQSNGQLKWLSTNSEIPLIISKHVVDIATDDSRCILIETSLLSHLKPIFLEHYIDENKLIDIFKEYFIPKAKYSQFISEVTDIDVGISIRRGEFLDYFPEARQSYNDIIDWVLSISKHSSKMVIFSDDHEFRDILVADVISKFHGEKTIVTLDFTNFEQWEVAFLEFLILSEKCNKIYGTPSSSFAQIASLFRGKRHYSEILSCPQFS